MGSPHRCSILGKSTAELREVSEDSRLASRSVASFHISFLLCTLTACGFLLTSEQTVHWFVIPVLFCGVLIGCDAIDWFRGRLGLFDPAGIIGLLGVHFFFLAPLLHVTWDSWMRYIVPPPEWRDWLGGMAIVNAAGLVLYRCAKRRAGIWGKRATKETVWRLNRKLLLWGAGCGLMLSGALQIWIYAQQGGIIGYIETFTQAVSDPDLSAGFKGMGWIFMLSESFPILGMVYFAVCIGRSRTARTWLVITLVLLGFFVLQMLFGGLRGSRGNTVWALFWAAGIIHFWIHPLNRRFVFVGFCFLLVFMYLYGFYKDLGGEVWTAYRAGEIPPERTTKAGRTLDGMLLGDLGRSDVQAFLLYRLSMSDRDYQYALGKTYLASATLLIPRAFWPDRPSGKVKAGTEAQYGVGSYDEHKFTSSLVYGLAGEAMLNFGPIAVPFVYGVFGLVVGALQRFMYTLRHGDTRLLLYPFLVSCCFSILQSDSDNLLFIIIKGGFLPALVVWFGSHVLIESPIAESGLRTNTILPKPRPLEPT
jgi:hypothetical protein